MALKTEREPVHCPKCGETRLIEFVRTVINPRDAQRSLEYVCAVCANIWRVRP